MQQQFAVQPSRRPAWVLWGIIGAAALVLVCGVVGIGGFLWLRSQSADWFRIDGLPAPTADLEQVATVDTPPGTKYVASAADANTVYYVAARVGGLTIGASPIAEGGRRWQAEGPALPNAVPRTAVVGSVLLVVVQVGLGNRRLAFRTSDGAPLSDESWDTAAGNVHAAADGTDLITTRPTGDRRPAVISRVDFATGTARWTYPVTSPVRDVSARLSWFGGQTAGTSYAHLDEVGSDLRAGLPVDAGTVVAWDLDGIVHVLDGATGRARVTRTVGRMVDVTVFGDAVYGIVEIDDERSVVALDLGTLVERWRNDMRDAVSVEPCGPTQLCVTSGIMSSATIDVLDAGTGASTPLIVPNRARVANLTPVGGRIVASMINEGRTSIVDSVSPWRGTELRYEGKDLRTLAVGGRTAIVGRFSVSAGPNDETGLVVSAVDVANMRSSRGVVLDVEIGTGITVADRYIVVLAHSTNQLVVLRNPFA
jgi:hypothetical protein